MTDFHLMNLVKYFSPTTNLCIIRVGRDHHNIAWAALTLLTAIEGVRYIPNVVHISGELATFFLLLPMQLVSFLFL